MNRERQDAQEIWSTLGWMFLLHATCCPLTVCAEYVDDSFWLVNKGIKFIDAVFLGMSQDVLYKTSPVFKQLLCQGIKLVVWLFWMTRAVFLKSLGRHHSFSSNQLNLATQWIFQKWILKNAFWIPVPQEHSLVGEIFSLYRWENGRQRPVLSWWFAATYPDLAGSETDKMYLHYHRWMIWSNFSSSFKLQSRGCQTMAHIVIALNIDTNVHYTIYW